MRRPTLLAVLVALLLAFGLSASAQQTVTTASLSGEVLDPTGSLIPHVLVTATQLSTNQSRSARTDSEGRFHFPYLVVGDYQLRVEQPGFTSLTRALDLSVGDAFDLVITLSVGSATADINVTAPSAVVEQNRSQIAATITQAEATNLPFNARNYLDLALLAPGVSPTNTASVQTFAETSPVIGQGYSINSQRNFSNSFIVDGLSANDDAAGLTGNSYSLDVVREFQVVTSGGQAEFGRALGGYVNLITRSGSNALHGTAYGFLRNQRLNAQNALSRGKLPLTQSQVGGSVSGPLRRDRTFFFANVEQLRLNTSGLITISPANAITINAHLLAVGYQAPLLSVGSGAATLYPTTVHTTNAFARVDHQFSKRDQFSLRYSQYRLDSLNARGVGSLAAVSDGTAVQDLNHTVAVSNIATLSPHVFNETRGQFTYDSLNAPPNDSVGPTVTISGIAQFGRFSSSPTARLNDGYEAVENLVIERGAHTLKSGVDLLVNDDTITFPQSLRGAYTFSSLANFLAGTYNTQGFTQSFGIPSIQQINPNYGLYAQDEWKLARSLTLNTGLRYDLQFLQTIHTDRGNLSPRLGLAWSPNSRTVLRASYGLFFDRIPLRALANALLSASNTTDPHHAALLSYTFTPGQPGAPAFPNIAAAPPANALLNYTLMDPHIQNAYAQQASLEVEQQLWSGSTLGLSYQHVRGLHLLTSINTNIRPDGTRPNPAFANSRVYSAAADSTYDGLAVSFLERPRPWGSARLSYTWSKAIDDVGEFFFSAPINNASVGQDRSRSDDDQRHRLVLDVILHTPVTPATTLRSHLGHGWQLSGILQSYSRLPFNITTGTTTRQGTTQRPCTPAFTLTATAGLNPCTEALPGAVIGRNAGIGFPFVSLNTRLSRTLALTERVHLEAIAEAFNTLNHRNNLIPNGTWGTNPFPAAPNPTFGQPTAVADPRSLQLAARLTF